MKYIRSSQSCYREDVIGAMVRGVYLMKYKENTLFGEIYLLLNFFDYIIVDFMQFNVTAVEFMC
jgi:hypothetical protein